MKRILVIGAGGSAGINFVDCLRKAKEEFYIVGTDTNKWHLELPDLDSQYILLDCVDSNYIDTLNRIIEKEDIGFVHPQPDIAVKILSDKRDKIHARMFIPDKVTIDICQDKIKLNTILEQNGVPVPKAYLINDRELLKEAVMLLRNIHEKIWLRATKGAGAKASLPILDEEQGTAWIKYWEIMKGVGYGAFMACEFLPGREFAFQSVWKDGELIISAARERLEYIFGELTPSGQSSSPSVARVVYREDVNQIATAAILAIDKRATGIFCVDLKENVEGIPCVTEINAGRFFTTSNFFASIGANMPYSYVKLAYGEETGLLKTYNAATEGYYWIRLMDKGPILIKEGMWKSEIV